MAGVAEENRRRIASVLCLLGAGLMLAGVALVIRHREVVSAGRTVLSPAATDPDMMLVYVIKQVLFWVFVLVGVFGLSTFAFLRWSRRYRKWLFHRPHAPTPADDLWSMHHLPDEPPAGAGGRRRSRHPHGGD